MEFVISCTIGIVILGSSGLWLAGILLWAGRRRFGGHKPLSVSVIVVGRNEQLYIRTVLDSILSNVYSDASWDVYFVDDHSSDKTLEIALDIASNYPDRLHVLSAPEAPIGISPKKSALAWGIRHAGGELILCTDADSQVHPRWISDMASSYGSNTGAVAGAAIPSKGRSVHERLYRVERVTTALTSASAIGWGSPASVTGQNFSFRRSVFEELGGHAHPEVPSGDDDLLAQGIARRGWKVEFCASPFSVVKDLRTPTLSAHFAAATRHQSVTRYYPARWRWAYAVTIASGWLTIIAVGVPAFKGLLPIPILAIVAGKALVDWFAVRVIANRLRFPLSLAEFMASEIILPIYLIVKPLLLLRSSYEWRMRHHSMGHHPSPDSVG